MVGPIVEEIAQEREDIAVGKVNVDEEVELAMDSASPASPRWWSWNTARS